MKDTELAKFVQPIYSGKDSMHNFNHIIRIKKKIAFLRKDYKNIDESKLKMLIYFHGAKDWLKKNKLKFLKSGFNNEDIISINRHTKKPKTIEEKLVSDANLLEAVGNFGIKKSLRVGKERGRTRAEAIDFIRRNIKNIKFYTKKGKIIGKKGIKIINNFLKKQ